MHSFIDPRIVICLNFSLYCNLSQSEPNRRFRPHLSGLAICKANDKAGWCRKGNKTFNSTLPCLTLEVSASSKLRHEHRPTTGPPSSDVKHRLVLTPTISRS